MKIEALSKEQIYACIGGVAEISDFTVKDLLMDILDEALTNIINPPVEEKKRTVNRSGVVQVDPETGMEIARFATIKEANIALGKKEKASGIGDAANGRTKTHKAYDYVWYHVDEWDAMTQDEK